MVEPKKVLITGAHGFLGGAILEAFRQESKYQTCGLISPKRKPDLAAGKEKFLCADITNYETFKEIEELKQVETVVHAAGLAHQFGETARESFWRVNVEGTENVCRAAKALSARRLILISSVAVYGRHDDAVDETSVCDPQGFYAESKLESENRARAFCAENEIDLAILRPATIIGEGDRGNNMRLITAIDKNRFVWIGRGENRKTLIYKTDVARAVVKTAAAAKNYEGEVFNIAGEAVTMRAVVETIAAGLGKKNPRLYVPERLFRRMFALNEKTIALSFLKKIENTFEKWVSNDVFSGQKIEREMGFVPEVSVAEALGREVNFYLQHKEKG